MVKEGKKVRVKVRTIHGQYIGDLFVPSKRNRLSDVVNEPDPIFINLTGVEVDGTPQKAQHICLNKYLIESIEGLPL